MLLGFHDSLSFTSSSFPLNFLGRKKIQREEKNLNPFRALKTTKALLQLLLCWRTAGTEMFQEVFTLQGAVISSLGRRRNEEV